MLGDRSREAAQPERGLASLHVQDAAFHDASAPNPARNLDIVFATNPIGQQIDFLR